MRTFTPNHSRKVVDRIILCGSAVEEASQTKAVPLNRGTGGEDLRAQRHQCGKTN